MASHPLRSVLENLRRSALLHEGAERSDSQLLEAFLRSRDALALEVLVRRHGPMVWGICRRTLANHHEAEDAFQATFVVLLRKAVSIRTPELLPNWLYRVEYKTACKARQRAAIRASREKQVRVMPEPPMEPHDDTFGPELRALLDEEVGRLPEKYRIAVVLCDVQGRTRHDAAKRLRLPEGTVASRLATGRALLAKRLLRRGLAVSATSLAATGLQQSASGAVPAALLANTAKAVGLLAAGQTATEGLISTAASPLADSVVRAMAIAKHKTAVLILLLVGLVPSGGLLAHHAWTAGHPSSGDEHHSVRVPDGSRNENPPADRNDEPRWRLPELVPAKVGEIGSYKAPTAKGPVTAVAFSHGGRRAITCADDGFVRQYDLASGKELWAFDTHAAGPGAARDLAVSRDGRLALVAVGDCTVRLLDTKTGQEGRRFEGHKSMVEGVSFSKSGRLALSASGTWYPNVEHDNTVRLWDVATGKEIRRFEGHTSWVSIPVFSPDERYVLSPSDDRTIRMWDVETGEEVRRFVGHAGFIRTAVFSRDGRWILSSSEDSTLRLWDAATGAETRRFGGHWGIVEAAVLSPDGSRALSAGKDGMLRLWNVATGKQLNCLKGHNGPVNAVALFPDGKHALTGGWDGTMRLWRLPDPEATPASNNGDGTVTKANATEDKTAQEKWKEDSAAAVLEANGAKLTRDDNLPGKPVVEVRLAGRRLATDAILGQLQDLRSLQRLYLGSSSITNVGLEYFRNLKSLRVLDLGNTRVTNEGLKHLAELDGLFALALVQTRVTDAGLEHLKGLKGLQHLLLQGTQVSDAGVNELRKALPQCKVQK
jgi:RNA polymerase sigma factor (sigma-70 family)